MATNTLFNQPLMNKYLKRYKKELSLTHSKKEAVLKWIKKLEKGELKEEVANYGSFSRIILEDILGYDYEENIIENVKEDYGRGLSEFALKKDDKKFMVIELKGSDTDLDKPQKRLNDKRTPVDQAFDYAKRSGDIDWIMVSNYNKFRLYNWHKKQHQYISFHIGELLDPETFKKFMLVFSKFSIENNLIENLLSKTIFVERDLEAEFYKLYNETRLMIIAELEHIHPEFTRDESVHYAQLILNRYIFICFAEDLGLLPGEITVETISGVKNLRGSEIWHDLNGLFLDVNNGSEFREEKIFGYNGGLFSEDIEFLKIRDIVDDHSIFKDVYQKWKFEEYSLIVEEKLSPYSGKINPIYKNLMIISSFNFSSEVDVNILGHIFENSIGEIEELKADQKDRRKKEGIFYTPEDITDYICRNTIIPYLSKSGEANTIEDLIREFWGSGIDELEQNIRKIKIVDPACGSGAFLNKAGDILLEIHQAILEQRYKDDKSLMPYFDRIKERREILLNNIYGVDLNEESVEITKLSLFLKVCKEGLKLPNLDNNIKCGNSLIDDPEYTDKPFNWGEEFYDIFANGGFDVVIGNPPYVRQEKIKEIKPYLKEYYETFSGTADLYVYFFEKGIKILKDGRNMGFISSNKFIRTKYGENLRKFILKNTSLKKYFDHSHDNIFDDATTYPSIFILENGFSSKNNILVNDKFEIPQSKLGEGVWNIESPIVLNLRDKIKNTGIQLKSIEGLGIYYGVKTGFNKAFIINKKIKDSLIEQDKSNEAIIKILARGKDIKKYKVNLKGFYLIFTRRSIVIDDYPSIKEYLTQFKDNLTPKNQGQKLGRKSGDYEWYEIQDTVDYFKEFEKDKIIWAEIALKPAFTLDIDKIFLLNTCYLLTIDNENFNLKYLLSLMNSKLIYWQFKYISTSVRGGYLRYTKQYVEKIPIYPATVKEQKPFIGKAELMLKLNNQLLDEVAGFHDWLNHIFKIEKLSQKLERYYELSIDELIDEVKKKKVNVKSRENYQVLKEGFNNSLKKISPLLIQIEETNNEIDRMVYELYGLDDDEIEIIENTLSNKL